MGCVLYNPGIVDFLFCCKASDRLWGPSRPLLSAHRGLFPREEAGTNYRGPAVRKGVRGPTMLQVFVFLGSIIICRLYKLPFRPSLSHSATESQSFRCSVNIFRWSVLARGHEKKFSPGPEPALGDPGDRGLKFNNHLRLVPWLSIRGAIPPLSHRYIHGLYAGTSPH